MQAQKIQHRRQQALNVQASNSQLSSTEYAKPEALDFLAKAIEKLGQSARAYHRLLKIARTIADLELAKQESTDVGKVEAKHIKEALGFRLDRN